ncbi:MAG TPA: endonuclease/exonuclease/phosphatase family protein, partial [Vicinamibacterales bacterium]|nr:endonuclease/exonuclease/phosphatase family protein [Vicinamibacterales bacterium]
MSVRFWCAALLALTTAAAGYLEARDRHERGHHVPVRVRVLSYNVHHGEGMDGRIDLARQADVLNREAPELVALQEVDRSTRRSGGVDQLAEFARLTGLTPVFGRTIEFQGGGYGVGVLSRLPLQGIRQRLLPGSPDREPRTALTVDVDLPGGGPRVQFTATHLDQGREAADKLAQASYLAAALSHRNDQLGILAGDMNTRPETEPMQILARRWTDTFADPPPDSNGRPRRRIDYVMVRPAQAWRVIESRSVDAPLASDHQPVLVVLEWTGATDRAVRAAP